MNQYTISAYRTHGDGTRNCVPVAKAELINGQYVVTRNGQTLGVYGTLDLARDETYRTLGYTARDQRALSIRQA